MTASYVTRLLLQCLSLTFLVHLFFSFAVLLATPLAVRGSERLRPENGVRLLFLLRIFPVLAAFYAAVAIALPSYLRLEPDAESERIGPWAICFSAAALCLFIRPSLCTAIALSRSSRLLKRVQQSGRSSAIASNVVWISNETRPQVAATGLLRTHLLLSEAALKIFLPEQLEVVLDHENAHRRSRDNLKRLCWLILPDALPFVSVAGGLERAYKRLVEWAADDFAVAGNRQKAMALAGALVAFARQQSRASGCTLAISLIDDPADLAKRVERLLTSRPRSAPHKYPFLTFVSGVAITLAITTVHFADLPHVHRLLESLSH
jgi:Zn-dependent protease with chaperone function